MGHRGLTHLGDGEDESDEALGAVEDLQTDRQTDKG